MLHLVSSSEGRKLDSPVSTVTGPAEDELIRLESVKRYAILDTPPEAAFDRVTALAADLFGAPISILSFVGMYRVFFKSHHGLGETEINRGPGMSAAALDPWIRTGFKHGFHVSVPLRTPDGHELGKLSVIDRRPRRVERQQILRLRSLGAIVMDQLELRLSAYEAARRAVMMSSEVDHRAMNSLQLIASLLNLQSRTAGLPAASRQLRAAANRVLAVARVHRTFSIDEPNDRVPILAYLHKLCGELSAVLATDIKVEGVETSIPKAQILPIGLVMNELVTNAKKHGAGKITVALKSGPEGHHELCVLDEGKGLPKDFAVERPDRDGIGMKVVTALVTQLNGQLSAYANPAGRGSCFAVAFPPG